MSPSYGHFKLVVDCLVQLWFVYERCLCQVDLMVSKESDTPAIDACSLVSKKGSRLKFFLSFVPTTGISEHCDGILARVRAPRMKGQVRSLMLTRLLILLWRI